MKAKHIVIVGAVLIAAGAGYWYWSKNKKPAFLSGQSKDAPSPKLTEQRKGRGDKLISGGGGRPDRFGSGVAPSFSDGYLSASGHSINDKIVQASRQQLMY